MVEAYLYDDPENHKGASVLLIDDPDGEFQEWIRERCPDSVVEYYRSAMGGTVSQVWLKATKEVREALEDRLDEIIFDYGPYTGNRGGLEGVRSDHFLSMFDEDTA